jgi:fibronectin type 3 domain-containing protein
MKNGISLSRLSCAVFLLAAGVSIAALIGCASTDIAPASKLHDGKATLSWNPVPGATSYNVYFSRSPGVTKSTGVKIRDAISPFTIVDLEPGKTYYFVLTMVDDTGESPESPEKSYLAAETAGPVHFDDPFPGKQAPETQLTAGQPADGQATLSWDSVPGAVSYNIYWKASPGVNKQNGKKISKVASPYTLKGLERGKTYYFVITAVKGSTESKESEEIAFKVK